MSDGMVMLSGRVPPELKRMVDADPRDNQDVIQAALWDEFGGERKAAVEKRIQNKRNQLRAAEDTLADERENVEELREEIEELKQAKENVEEKEDEREAEIQATVQDLLESKTPLEPDNPAIKNKAGELDLTPEELVEKAREERGGAL